jgi:hypothetical protein
MIYFDSSYLIKCYLPEPGHELVRELAREQPFVSCCILGKVECRAAVHRHFREGRLNRVQADTVHLVMDEDDGAHLWRWLELRETMISEASAEFRMKGSVLTIDNDALDHADMRRVRVAHRVFKEKGPAAKREIGAGTRGAWAAYE